MLASNLGTQVYRPGYRAKSDADILRDAKLEAMGLPPQEDSPRRSNYERNHMATDEIVRIYICRAPHPIDSGMVSRLWNGSKNMCAWDRPFSVSRRSELDTKRNVGGTSILRDEYSLMCPVYYVYME